MLDEWDTERVKAESAEEEAERMSTEHKQQSKLLEEKRNECQHWEHAHKMQTGVYVYMCIL